MIMKETFIKFTVNDLKPQFLTVTIADTEALLRFLYKEIGCESIENVYTRLDLQLDTADRIIMVVDEEGLLKDHPQPNPTGCALYNGLIAGTLIIGRQVERDGEPDFGGFASVADAIAAASEAERMTFYYLCNNMI